MSEHHLQTSAARSEPSWLRAGGALHIKMAGRPTEWGLLRTFATEGSEQGPPEKLVNAFLISPTSTQSG